MAGMGSSFSLAAEKEVRWYTWGTYYAPDYVQEFVNTKNIDVSAGFITGNDEQLAKLKAGGTHDWDVWDAENAMTQLHIENGLVKPLDMSRIPNSANLFPHLVDAPWTMGPDGKPYFICHIFGIDTLAYRTDMIEKPTTWNDLFNPEYKGRVTMQDYALDGINIAGLALFGRENYSAWTDDQMAAIVTLLEEQNGRVRSYWSSEADCRNLFLNGEVVIGTSWVPTAFALRDEGVPVDVSIPKEGAIGWSDNLGISIDATPEQEEVAYELINYLMGETYGTKINVGGPYTTGTTVSWIDKLDASTQENLFLTQSELLGLSNFRKLPPNYDEWSQIWEEVKLS